jgi:hypothetical protein
MTIKPSKCILKQVVKNVKKIRHSRFGGEKWRENVNLNCGELLLNCEDKLTVRSIKLLSKQRKLVVESFTVRRY